MKVEDLIFEATPKLIQKNETMETTTCDLSIDKSCATQPKDLSAPIVAEIPVVVVKEDIKPVSKTCCEKMKSYINPENALKAAIFSAGIGLIYVIYKNK